MTQLADPMSDRADTFEIERALEAYAEATRIVASARVVRGLQERVRQERDRGGMARAVDALRARVAVMGRPSVGWDPGIGSGRGLAAALRMPSLLALLLAALTLGAAVGGAGALLPGRLDGPALPGPVVPGPNLPGPVVPGPRWVAPAPDAADPADTPSLRSGPAPSPAPSPPVTVRSEALRTPSDGRRADRRRARDLRRSRAADVRRQARLGALRGDGCVLVGAGSVEIGSGPLAC